MNDGKHKIKIKNVTSSTGQQLINKSLDKSKEDLKVSIGTHFKYFHKGSNSGVFEKDQSSIPSNNLNTRRGNCMSGLSNTNFPNVNDRVIKGTKLTSSLLLETANMTNRVNLKKDVINLYGKSTKKINSEIKSNYFYFT